MITADIQKLEPGELVALYELDASEIGGDVLRFHGYAQGPIWWQGNEYSPWAIEATGHCAMAHEAEIRRWQAHPSFREPLKGRQ